MAADGGAVGWSREIEHSRKSAKTGGAGSTRIVVMLETASKNVEIPDQCWHPTTSSFGHISHSRYQKKKEKNIIC